MKILYITGSQDIATGIGRHSFNLTQAFRQLGHEVALVCISTQGLSQGPRVWKFLKLIRFLLWNIIRVRGKNTDFDLIYAHDFFPFAIVAYFARKKHQKFFINGIGTDLLARLDKPVIGYLLQKALQKADKVLCISHFTRDEIKSAVPGADNLAIIHLGVDYDKFYFDLSHKKFFSQDRSSGPVLIGVGMVKRRKGFDVAIKSLVKVKEKYPSVRYYIVGPIPETKYIDSLKKLVLHLGLTDNVVFTGKVSDQKLIDLYRLADLFVLTPVNIGRHFEGFGLVYLEANATGLPVIGSLGCGAQDAIEENVSGYLVGQGDFHGTAIKILELLSDFDRLKHISFSAQAWAYKFTWEKTALSIADQA